MKTRSVPAILLLFACTPPEFAERVPPTAAGVCERFTEVGCSADLNGYRDANDSGTANAACVEPAPDCVACEEFWSNLSREAEEDGCRPEVTDLFECLIETAQAGGNDVCLTACGSESDAFRACSRPGEQACRDAGEAVLELACTPSDPPPNSGQFCSDMPDGCAEFWDGFAETVRCFEEDNDPTTTTWDFEVYPVETQVDGVYCISNTPDLFGESTQQAN